MSQQESNDDGIEILTGAKAREIKPDGTYPKGTIDALVSGKLKELAERLKRFGAEENKEDEEKKRRKKKA
jgi:hypothetical protein